METERARELERNLPKGRPVDAPTRVERRLMRLVAKAKRLGLSPREIEGVVRWALRT